MNVRPNVLFLSVDALRRDRMSLYGYGRPTTPVLDSLAANAVICNDTVSNGAFTQVSFHSFMTSSRPLSHGGYDMGAVNRPPSLFSVFGQAGYETMLLGNFAWVSRYFGYGPVDRECNLFILNAFVGIHGSGTMASPLRAWHRGEISVDEALANIEHLIIKVFDDIEDYCAGRLEQAPFDRLDFANSQLLAQGYDYARVLKVVGRHRVEFMGDKRAYLQRHLTKVPGAHEWIARDWRYCRTPGKLAREAAFRIGNGSLGLVNPKLARLREYRTKRYMDGADLADRVLREIETRRHPERPFFLWTHFVDTHVPYCPGRGRQWYRCTPDYLAALGYPRDLDPSVALMERPQTKEQWETWSALYDAAVSYVDEQIGRIIGGLDRAGLGENTLLVVCGDHGEELGEHGDISHHFRLYDHNIAVPLMFRRPGLAQRRIDSLSTLLDLAPSIADFADVPPDPGWEGAPVTAPSVAARRHVVLEALHGGSCLFAHRPIYMAVRTKRWKYLWKEYRDPTDHFSADGHELYDIAADPLEQDNLYRPDHPTLPGFNALIAGRLSEIPEISAARIATAFGRDVVDRANGLEAGSDKTLTDEARL